MNTHDDRHQIFKDIDVEHAEMRTLLASVHKVLADRSQPASEVVATLDSFFGFLQTHFKHEDEGGFFDEITEQSPRLSERADEVQGEHAALLEECQTLKDLAAKREANDAWWDQLNSGFHRLSKQLMHHEHREEDLLQESFTDEIGTGD